jgi:hypothetical protein
MRIKLVDLQGELGEFLPDVNRNEESHHMNCTLAHNLAVVVLVVGTTLLRRLADLFQNI